MWFIAATSVESWWKPDVWIQLFKNVSFTSATAWVVMRGEQAQQTLHVDKPMKLPRFSLLASRIWDFWGLSTYYLTKDTKARVFVMKSQEEMCLCKQRIGIFKWFWLVFIEDQSSDLLFWGFRGLIRSCFCFYSWVCYDLEFSSANMQVNS